MTEQLYTSYTSLLRICLIVILICAIVLTFPSVWTVILTIAIGMILSHKVRK